MGSNESRVHTVYIPFSTKSTPRLQVKPGPSSNASHSALRLLRPRLLDHLPTSGAIRALTRRRRAIRRVLAFSRERVLRSKSSCGPEFGDSKLDGRLVTQIFRFAVSPTAEARLTQGPTWTKEDESTKGGTRCGRLDEVDGPLTSFQLQGKCFVCYFLGTMCSLHFQYLSVPSEVYSYIL